MIKVLEIVFLIVLAIVTVSVGLRQDNYKGAHRKGKNNGKQTGNEQVRKGSSSVPLNFTAAKDASESGVNWRSGRSKEGSEQMHFSEQDRIEQDGDTQWVKREHV